MPSKQSGILTVYQAQFFAKLHKQNWLHFKIFMSIIWSNEKERNECNGKVLGAFDDLLFGKPCTWIHKS
jgi:hypothetical protein